MTTTFKIYGGDVVRNTASGLYSTLSNKDKLNQDVRTMLATNIRTVSDQGCGLDMAVGKDQKNPVSSHVSTPVMFEFQLLVRSGLERLRRAQRRYMFSQRTTSELIYDFSPVQVWLDQHDPRTVRWKVDIKTIDGRSSFSVGGKFRS